MTIALLVSKGEWIVAEESFSDFLKRVAPELTEDQVHAIVLRFAENLGAALADAYSEGFEDGVGAGM
jgi:hypothetical protein